MKQIPCVYYEYILPLFNTFHKSITNIQVNYKNKMLNMLLCNFIFICWLLSRILWKHIFCPFLLYSRVTYNGLFGYVQCLIVRMCTLLLLESILDKTSESVYHLVFGSIHSLCSSRATLLGMYSKYTDILVSVASLVTLTASLFPYTPT